MQSSTLQKHRLLGRGKYTDVFLDSSATKVIKEAKNKSAQSIRQIENEFEKLQLINKAKISPKVYQISNDADGIPFLVMDFIEGKTLRSILDECEGLGEKLSSEFAFSLIDQISRSVYTLHQHYHLGHFDLSPDNILVSNDGSCIYLIDFSLARSEQEFQLIDEAVGKVDYMAPEAYEKEFGLHNDIYSLGIILDEIKNNAESLGFAVDLDFLIASMKLPMVEARIKIDEVVKQVNQFKTQSFELKEGDRKKWVVGLTIISALFVAALFFNSSETKPKMTNKSKLSKQVKYEKKQRINKKRKKIKKGQQKKTKKFKINNETKNIFKRIVK
jgi:serine/threonine protein kinase